MAVRALLLLHSIETIINTLRVCVCVCICTFEPTHQIRQNSSIKFHFYSLTSGHSTAEKRRPIPRARVKEPTHARRITAKLIEIDKYGTSNGQCAFLSHRNNTIDADAATAAVAFQSVHLTIL